VILDTQHQWLYNQSNSSPSIKNNLKNSKNKVTILYLLILKEQFFVEQDDE